jgi:phenylacetate-CoA ligase
LALADFLCRHFTELYTVWREGNRYIPISRGLEKAQYDPPEMVRARQLAALRRIVAYAAANVPLYRERFRAAGIEPGDVKTFEDFARLPVLTKTDLRREFDRLKADGYPDRDTVKKTTSGSTGRPLAVLVNRQSVEWKMACTLRADQWSGWRLGQPIAKVWGNPEYQHHGWRGWLRNRLMERARYLDTLHVTDETMAAFAKTIRRLRPRLIFGHAHSVHLFAQYLHRNGITPPRPAGIITSAMTLHPFQRERIEEVFGTKVTNRYGCEEVSLIACECEAHRGLHINADSVYVEVDGPTAADGTRTGPALVTDLTNLAMPLIRYQVGDVCTLSDRQCSCGRTLPMMEEIHGREADYLITPEGVRVSGVSLTENFILLTDGVEQVQLVQHALDRFTVRVVPEAGFGERGRGQIERLFRERFGPSATYRLEIVDSIPTWPNGKVRFCICEVPADELAAAGVPAGGSG